MFFVLLLTLADVVVFFKINFFQNFFSGLTLSECQTIWLQIMTFCWLLSGSKLFYNGYQQMTKVATSKERCNTDQAFKSSDGIEGGVDSDQTAPSLMVRSRSTLF